MSNLVVDISDLLQGPASRDLKVITTGDGLSNSSAKVAGDITIDLHLAHIGGGLVARGTISGQFEGECSICLDPITSTFEVLVGELFEADAIEGETYEIVGETIDLQQLVTDAVVLELPTILRCSQVDECQERSIHVEQLVTDEPDPRWAILSQVEIEES